MSREGAVVWFTGLPASGKSTLRGGCTKISHVRSCVLLDGDDVRTALGAHSYEPEARDAFYHALASLAVLLAKQGHAVLVAATAPRRAYRELAHAAPLFFEVYMRAPLALCEAHDMKGLYDRASTGQIKTLPGVGAEYEAPLEPAITADGGHDGIAVQAIIERLR